MTLIQFFFHLEQDKQIGIHTEKKHLFFFERNKDPETKDDFYYTGIAQEGLNQPEYFGFTKERLTKLLENNPSVLENAFIAEIDSIEGKPDLWTKIKFFLWGH